MKKMLVGMTILVLMATMAIPALGDTEDMLKEVYQKYTGNQIYVIENVESCTDDEGRETTTVYMKDGVTITYYTEDYNDYYVASQGMYSYVYIRVVRHSKILGKLGEGADWVSNKVRDGFYHIKGWFVHDDV